jgi:hypothetical protein
VLRALATRASAHHGRVRVKARGLVRVSSATGQTRALWEFRCHQMAVGRSSNTDFRPKLPPERARSPLQTLGDLAAAILAMGRCLNRALMEFES